LKIKVKIEFTFKMTTIFPRQIKVQQTFEKWYEKNKNPDWTEEEAKKWFEFQCDEIELHYEEYYLYSRNYMRGRYHYTKWVRDHLEEFMKAVPGPLPPSKLYLLMDPYQQLYENELEIKDSLVENEAIKQGMLLIDKCPENEYILIRVSKDHEGITIYSFLHRRNNIIEHITKYDITKLKIAIDKL
jgi:hypothetical protein